MTEPRTAQSAFPPPHGLVALVRDGTLDAELAALLWITVEGGIPLLVAGMDGEGQRVVRDALLTIVPAGRAVVRLAGADETFSWMPQAGELGWRSSSAAAPGRPGAVMVADFDDPPAAAGRWGDVAHLAIRALSTGYSLMATMPGMGLEDVVGRLGGPPVAASEDELARLGVVLVLADGGPGAGPGAGPRAAPQVEAAHYFRPVARDPGGHVQRLPPAVLATRNRMTGRFDHFAWGVTAELAARTGRRPIDFEREQAERAVAISSATT